MRRMKHMKKEKHEHGREKTDVITTGRGRGQGCTEDGNR
jgi:hypothetical protein